MKIIGSMPPPAIIGFTTHGDQTEDLARLETLLREFPRATFFQFDRRRKLRSGLALFASIRRTRPDLVVMEGTGLAGGLAVLLARLVTRTPYIVRSGDPVAPFIALYHPYLRWAARIYEGILYRRSAGFIGWTPYLTGRALTFGVERAMTAAGWSIFEHRETERERRRADTRKALGIPTDAIVIGILGSLAYNPRVSYCYGLELVRVVSRLAREDVCALIVGGGNGRALLERLAGPLLNRRIFITGRVPADDVPGVLAAMDMGSLPQSVDQLGSFRYTTKISEFLAAGLPIVTGQIPLAYDFSDDWLWTVPGPNPWSEEYLEGLARLLRDVSREAIARKRAAVPTRAREFDCDVQVRTVTRFIDDVLARERNGRR